MLYQESNRPHLKRWIVTRLEDTSDADSDILADYVLALLKHEDSEGVTTKELCATELKDFFQDGISDSEKFVNELFRIIEYKAYLPGAPPPPDVNAPPPNAPTGPKKSTAGMKRKHEGELDMDDCPGASKVSRAGSPGRGNGFVDPRGQPQSWTGGYPMTAPMSMGSTPVSGAENGGLDFNALANMAMLNQSLLQILAGAMTGEDGNKGNKGKKRRRMCKEWEKNGSCPRGDKCKYPHGGANGDFPMMDLSMLDNFPGFDFGSMQSQSGRKSKNGNPKDRIYDIEPGRIYIKEIPFEHFNEDSLRSFFSQFGEVSEVVLQAHNNTALLRFADEFAALAAIDSPKPVFDNRFVSVVAARKPRVGGELEVQVDLEEFRKKQEETQRIWEEKKKMRDELAEQLGELTRKETEIRMSQLELKRKIAEKEGRGSEEGDMDGLRAQLAALEDEAVALGLLNGSEMGDYGEGGIYCGAGAAYRGGGYRGGWRGRGRGAYRGRFRGDIHQAYRGATLDNRPKTVAIQGVDFTVEKHSEALRQYLMAVGSFNDIQSTPDTTNIFFEDRRTAEAFWNGLVVNPIPGITSELELSWVANQPVKITETGGSSLVVGGDEGFKGEEMKLSGAAKAFMPGQQVFKDEDEDEDEDYDVADENDWSGM